MTHLTAAQMAAVAAAAVAAGGINAAAGGGTLVSFPALLAVGVPALPANITNTVALTPGYLGGTWAYRRELRGQGRRAAALAPAAVAGAVAGAVLLIVSPGDLFRRAVPFLLLAACALLALQTPAARLVSAGGAGASGAARAALHAATFVAAVYGAYFGAGLGVVLIAVIAPLARDTLQRVNALKGLLSAVINGVAALCFVFTTRVEWGVVALMMPASLAGGVMGALAARRLDERWLRAAVIAAGLAAAVRILV